MADIDEVKEILNTLRVAMSIGFGIFVVKKIAAKTKEIKDL